MEKLENAKTFKDLNDTGNYLSNVYAQLCPTLCDPMYCSPPGSSVLEDSPGKNSGVDCHALLQGIFPTQGSNPGLLHCGWVLYQLSHKGSPHTLVTTSKYKLLKYNKLYHFHF